MFLLPCSLAITSNGRVGLLFCRRGLCPGTPEGSNGSGSGFKASQKTGPRLKASLDRLGGAGNRTCDPWFTKQRFIPYTTAASSRWTDSRSEIGSVRKRVPDYISLKINGFKKCRHNYP